MDEGGFDTSLVKRGPDMASAIFALNLADEALHHARERYSYEDFPGAFEHSRDAMRLASSAILFKDGYVCDNLGSTVLYLAQRYPGKFPVEAWEKAEAVPAENRSGLYNMMLGAVGKVKKAGEYEANGALASAEIFLESARMEMGI